MHVELGAARPGGAVRGLARGYGGARRTALLSVCLKRPFTTHADRLRPRLKGGRLPVAGPAARRAAGRGRRRRPRLPRLRVRRPRRPPGTRQLCARAEDGRRARRLEARPPRPAPSPTWSTPCRTCRPAAWACGCSPGKARRSTPPLPPGRLVFGIFAALAEVRAGADPRTHPGRAHGLAGATAAGRSRCRKRRCGWPRPRWRTATPPCPRSAANSGSPP